MSFILYVKNDYNTYWTIVVLVPFVLQVLHLGVNLISVKVVVILRGATLFSGLIFTDVWGVSSIADAISSWDDVVLTPLALGTDLI